MPSQTTEVTTQFENDNDNDKLKLHEYLMLFEDSRYEILEEYAQEGKLEEDWLWQLATAYIQTDNYEGMKKLHEVFGYEWKAPFSYPTLLPIASSYVRKSDRDDDTRIFEYMLRTGADLRELDYSEDWDLWEFDVKNVVEERGQKWYGVECREMIKWAIEQGDDPTILYEIMNKYM